MSFSKLSTSARSYRSKHLADAKWSGRNILFMVLGFVFFWPVGLLLLFWIISGRDIKDLPHATKQQWQRLFGDHKQSEQYGYHAVTHNHASDDHSDNVVFNEYQQTQYDRIEEIKKEVEERSERFNEFRSNAKRRADQEEFNDFMAKKPLKEA